MCACNAMATGVLTESSSYTLMMWRNQRARVVRRPNNEGDFCAITDPS